MLWYEAIQPYTRNWQVLFCPERPELGPGYGMNYMCSRLALAQSSSPAGVILVGDVLPEAICANPAFPGPAGRPIGWWVNDRGNDLIGAPWDVSYQAYGRPQVHSGGVIYGYLDGHVKWSPEEAVDDQEHWWPYR